MSDTRSLSQDLQTQILDSVRKGQDAVLDLVKSYVVKPYEEVVKSYVVKPYEEAVKSPAVKPFEDAVKSWSDAVGALVPQLPAASEVADKLPKPAELVDEAFAFAEQLLAAQKEFAHKMLEATAPLVDYARK